MKYTVKSTLRKLVLFVLFFSGISANFTAQITLEKEIKISDFALHFDGNRDTTDNSINAGDDQPYNYRFGNIISPHGDCLKTYNEFVFMTWYKGGKENRHVMLSRYNTTTGAIKTIEFPHRHTGFQNKYWIGESHNTIAVAISPLDGTIHMLYDMHAYSRTRPADGSLSKDYFRYSYSLKNSASVADEDFNLDQFVKDSSDGDYRHLGLNGTENYSAFAALTYPQFFLNDLGDLFMYIRSGGNNNGAYKFSKYTASTSTWSSFTDFNVLNAKNRGESYNWGLYGGMKYINGKIRIGFQKRSANNSDKYEYQNGIYYAYSDSQDGKSNWKNHRNEGFSLPLIDAEKTKIFEPGDLVPTTQEDKVYIIGDFGWTVTYNEDVHFISKVADRQNGITKNAHTYKKAGTTDFITSTDFFGAKAIYTYANDIYIIGLTNGRVFIEKAAGGTNDFRRVYQASGGKVFNHGKVHIANGKLHYFLMERKTGSAQPIYLQVIDLDIQEEPFTVSLDAPLDQQSFNVGNTLQLSANVNIDNGTVNKVEFLINDVALAEVNTAPYRLNWKPEASGTYSIKTIAYNNDNESVISKIITITVNSEDNIDLSGQIYRLRNVETGRYLDSENTNVITSVSPAGLDREWQFVKSGEFFNIDSQTSKGILRFVGGGSIINTNFGAPNSAVDKIWVFEYDDTDETYRFKSRLNTYLYNTADDKIIHSENTDARSKWKLELASIPIPLNISNQELNKESISVYPNPANNKFNIALTGLGNAAIMISDVLGKIVYRKSTSAKNIEISDMSKFTSGVYIIRVITDNLHVFSHKIIITN